MILVNRRPSCQVLALYEAGVIVEGVKMIKRHTRKSQQNPQGAIIEREGTVHISNLMLGSKFDARATKRGATAGSAKA